MAASIISAALELDLIDKCTATELVAGDLPVMTTVEPPSTTTIAAAAIKLVNQGAGADMNSLCIGVEVGGASSPTTTRT